MSRDDDDGKLAFSSYDLHVFATRAGSMAVSATLPNGKRTSRVVLNKFRRGVLLEILNEIKLYNKREIK